MPLTKVNGQMLDGAITADSSGNVGIGTSSPGARVHVVSAAGTVQLKWSDATNGTANLDTASGLSRIWTNVGLAFGTGAETFSERMRIDSSGNVGIGASSPGGILDVRGLNDTGAVTALIRNTSDIGNTTPFIDLRFTQRSNNADSGRIRIGRDGIYSGTLSTMDSYMAFFTALDNADTERMRIHSNGYITMGTTNTNIDAGPGFKFIATTNAYIGMVVESSINSQTNYHLYSTGAGTYRFYVGAGGTIYATATTIVAISDVRLKENIQDIDVGLDAIMALKPRKFDWKEGKGKDKKGDRGWIAQEFEQVFPDMIENWKDPAPEGEEPYKAVSADLIPVLVKAIQELKAELDATKAEVAELKAKGQ